MTVSSLLFTWRNWFGKHWSTIWNMVPACLMWLVWTKRNKRIFEDEEGTLDPLKALLFGTLFQWARIWGFTNCISISDFLHSIRVSLWTYCNFSWSECSPSWTWCSIFWIKVLLPIKKYIYSFVGSSNLCHRWITTASASELKRVIWKIQRHEGRFWHKRVSWSFKLQGSTESDWAWPMSKQYESMIKMFQFRVLHNVFSFPNFFFLSVSLPEVLVFVLR